MKYPKSYAYYCVEFLNEKGREQLKQIHKELHEEVQRIMSDEKHKGDIPYFSMNFTDTLLDTKLKDKK